MVAVSSEFGDIRQTDILQALQSEASGDLTQFLQALPGYWPADVVEDLKRISQTTTDYERPAERLLSQLAGPAPDPDLGDEVRLVLPVPHPLDADWRFTVRTRERLLELASAVSPRRETLLLGTPSIFAHMCSQLDLRAAVLVDANRDTINAAARLACDHDLLRAHHADLHAGVSNRLDPTFDTVIADPPWYFAEHRSFLDAASALLVPAGMLLMAAAPRGTRPGATLDRAELMSHAVDAGFDAIDVLEGELEYTSSPFERAALRQCGLPAVPTNWRRADLLILRRSSRPSVATAIESLRPKGWVERTLGRCRVKVRVGHSTSSSEAFCGAVIKSVSRLAPERSTANLWTSGNGAFNASDELIDGIRSSDDRWRGTVAGAALLGQVEAEHTDLRKWGWM